MNRMEGKVKRVRRGEGRKGECGGEEGKIPQSAGQREGTRDNVHPAKDG